MDPTRPTTLERAPRTPLAGTPVPPGPAAGNPSGAGDPGGTVRDGVLTPRRPPLSATLGRAVRVTGPGRLERAYQDQIRDLAAEVGDLHRRQHAAERELEVARLVERGTLRFVDRIEHECTLERQRKNRVLVTLGAVQAENARLRRSLESARSRLARIEAAREPEPSPFWARLLGRARTRD